MPNKIPKGLVFATKSKAHKTRIKILIPILILIQFSIVWPIYPFFSNAKTLILGLPLPFFWLILMVCAAFTALLIFFLKDTEEN